MLNTESDVVLHDEAWAKKAIAHHISNYIDYMIAHVDKWHDAFAIATERHGNKVWIERVQFENSQGHDFIFTKTLLRKWTMWIDLVCMCGFKRLPTCVDYKGHAYRVVEHHEQKHFADGTPLAMFRRYSETWRKEANAKRYVTYVLEKEKQLHDFLYVMPSRSWD